MPMLSGGGNYLSAKNCKTGDTLVFNDGGAWVESSKFTYPAVQKDGVTPHPKAGLPKSDLIFNVSVGGSKFDFRMNATNQNILKEKWGRDTDKWKGKMCRIDLCKVMVSGGIKDSIILTPVGDASVVESDHAMTPDEIDWES